MTPATTHGAAPVWACSKSALVDADARIAHLQGLRRQATLILCSWAKAQPGSLKEAAERLSVRPEYLTELFRKEGAYEPLDTLIAMLLRIGKTVDMRVN